MSSFPLCHSDGDRDEKRLERLFVREAKVEQKSIAHALEDVKEAERALRKSMKALEKAQKHAVKVKDQEHAAAKAISKAKLQHADALEREANAGETLSRRREREAELEHSVQQLCEDVANRQMALGANTKDRQARLTDVRARFEPRASSRM